MTIHAYYVMNFVCAQIYRQNKVDLKIVLDINVNDVSNFYNKTTKCMFIPFIFLVI